MSGSKPNFLIVGGVASGTSFLSHCMAQHPDIYMPVQFRPEPNFFHYSNRYSQGLDAYLTTWFSAAKGENAVGERSSLLLTSISAPTRILESLGRIRIIACLRNPVSRAHGNYRFTALEGLEDRSFAEALRTETDRSKTLTGHWSEVNPFAYAERSRYALSLQRYFDLFGQDNVLCLKSEALSADPEEELSRAFNFLDIPPLAHLSVPPSFSSPSVKSLDVQIRAREHFGDSFFEVIEQIRKGSLNAAAYSGKDSLVVEAIQNNLDFAHTKQIDSEALNLLRTMLSDDVKAFRELQLFDTSDWSI